MLSTSVSTEPEEGSVYFKVPLSTDTVMYSKYENGEETVYVSK